jgi:protease-4
MRLPWLPWMPVVAVVEFYEVIRGGRRSAEYITLLNGLRRNRRVRAVVLDIDSPGGSAPASEHLYLAARRLAERKPVVAFVRGVGASGAYMLACGATRIVALPGAVVGSIGVISLRPIAVELLRRIGLSIAVSKTGPFKDSGAFYREPTAEEQRKEQELLGEYYDAFLDIITAGRRLDRETVRAVATGEIFTGRRAQGLGLVDELGDLDTAIDLAAQLAGIRRHVVPVRPRRALAQRLLTGTASLVVDEVTMRLDRWLLTYH